MAGTAKSTTTKTTKKPVSTAAAKAAPKKAATKASREHMIAEAAYYRAEKRGFAGGNEMGDWLDAEVEIDQTMTRKPKAPAKK
jgi:Protein of unknown function (DUF2934)